MPMRFLNMDTHHIDVGELTLACRKAGKASDPCLVLLHGWPQTGLAWEGVLPELGRDSYVLAFDLPDVGESRGAPTAIPGLDPWQKILSDPRIWHFAFHLLPDLPETLVAGHERAYFDFFYNVMASDPQHLPDARRDAYARGYARRAALKAGFDWYRAMPKDAEHNSRRKETRTPMLYLRGAAAIPSRYFCLAMNASMLRASVTIGTPPPTTSASSNLRRSNFVPSAACAFVRRRLISLCPTL
jgi:pimeloyl-ACP methyl ester carboxylesterase